MLFDVRRRLASNAAAADPNLACRAPLRACL